MANYCEESGDRSGKAAVPHDKEKRLAESSETCLTSAFKSAARGMPSTLGHCPIWMEREAREKPCESVHPEAEGDDGSLAAVSDRLYTRINGLWQTRILQLLPGVVGSALQGEIFVADIVLRPGLGLHPDQRLTTYDALSYACGEAILVRRIRLQGESFPITENLYLALQSVRNPSEPMFLWVDAICIHQADAQEKSQQVVNMLDIYRKADHVHVWLGTCGKKAELALEFLSREKNGGELLHVRRCQSCFDRLLEGVEEVFTQPWFRRIWVKQEFYAAKQVIFHSDRLRFTGNFIALSDMNLGLLMKIHSNASITHTGIFRYGPNAAKIEMSVYLCADQAKIVKDALHWLRSFRHAKSEDWVVRSHGEKCDERLLDDEEHSSDIINVMRRCGKGECSDVRDYVYALLGMTNLNHRTDGAAYGDDRPLIVDYTKSAVQVFLDLTRHIIRRDQNLSILHLEVSYGPTASNPDLASLPSWVPDLRFISPRTSWLQALKDMPPRPYVLRGTNNSASEFRSWLSDGMGLPQSARMNPVLDRLPASQLYLQGSLIGSVEVGRNPATAAVYRVSSSTGVWNVFHQGHLYRSGLPAELAACVSSVREAWAVDATLQGIFAAVSESLGLEKIEARRSRSEDYYIQMNISSAQTAEPLGAVLAVARPPFGITKGYLRSEFNSILAPDGSTLAQVWYTAGSCAEMMADDPHQSRHELEEIFFPGLPSSWLLPRGAQSNDVIVMAVGSTLPLLLRPQASAMRYKFVGQAMPCQMTANDALPPETLRFFHKHLDKVSSEPEEFIVE